MKCTSIFFSLLVIATFVVAQPNYDFTKLKREHLGRGVIAIRENPSTVVVSWRIFLLIRWTNPLIYTGMVKR